MKNQSPFAKISTTSRCTQPTFEFFVSGVFILGLVIRVYGFVFPFKGFIVVGVLSL